MLVSFGIKDSLGPVGILHVVFTGVLLHHTIFVKVFFWSSLFWHLNIKLFFFIVFVLFRWNFRKWYYMFSLIEICCTYVAYWKILTLGKIGPDSSGDTSEIARNQKVNLFKYQHDYWMITDKEKLFLILRALVSATSRCCLNKTVNET